MSPATRALVDGELTELGEHRLKDFAEPVALFQLGRALPAAEDDLEHEPAAPRAPSSAASGSVGEVVALLADGTRLLTLTGPGGSGRPGSRSRPRPSSSGRSRQASSGSALAPLRDPALVTATIAQTLGAKDGLAEHIGERELLLVLDNLEQVVEAAPELAQLLEPAPT